MSAPLPDWFAADQIYATGDGWYIGAADGFRVGPFASEQLARDQSQDLVTRLAGCRDTTERVRLIRRFIIDQSRQNGRRVRAAASTLETAPEQDAGPPVRTGEGSRVWFRTHRVFAVGDAWFIATREGLDVGPYASRDEARAEAERLRDILQGLPDARSSRRAIEAFAADDGPDPV